MAQPCSNQHQADRPSGNAPTTRVRRRISRGADVIVTEIDPTKALEAVMDGFRVMPMGDAAKLGDIFVTVTGNKGILREEHFAAMKNGAIVANSGHFNVEIDIPALEKLSKSKTEAREFVEAYTLTDGRKIFLLGEGRLINLTSAEGHPASVMDMSFANQALAAEYLVANYKTMAKNVFAVPENLDKRVALLKLKAMGVRGSRSRKIQPKIWRSGDLRRRRARSLLHLAQR
jgi:adenosylhomocysteinase